MLRRQILTIILYGIGLTSIASLIYLAGPLISIGGWRPFEGYMVREISIVLLIAAVGSFIGLGLVTRVAEGIRDPKLVPIIPHPIYWIVPPVMLVICLVASGLALSRIRRLEPAMVFR